MQVKPSHRGLGNPRCAASGYVTGFLTGTTKGIIYLVRRWTQTRSGLRVWLPREEYSSGISLHPVLASSTEQGARKTKPWRVLRFLLFRFSAAPWPSNKQQ